MFLFSKRKVPWHFPVDITETIKSCLLNFLKLFQRLEKLGQGKISCGLGKHVTNNWNPGSKPPELQFKLDELETLG